MEMKIFTTSGAGLSNLHLQCKGYGFWLRTSGNHIGNLQIEVFDAYLKHYPEETLTFYLSADML